MVKVASTVRTFRVAKFLVAGKHQALAVTVLTYLILRYRVFVILLYRGFLILLTYMQLSIGRPFYLLDCRKGLFFLKHAFHIHSQTL